MEIVSYFDNVLTIISDGKIDKSPFGTINNIFKLSNRRTLVECLEELYVVDNATFNVLVIYEYYDIIRNFDIPIFDNFINDDNMRVYISHNIDESPIKEHTIISNAITFNGESIYLNKPLQEIDNGITIGCIIDNDDIYYVVFQSNINQNISIYRNQKCIKTWFCKDLFDTHNRIYTYLKVCELCTPTILIYTSDVTHNIIYIVMIEIINDHTFNVTKTQINILQAHYIIDVDINDIGIIVNYKQTTDDIYHCYKSRIDDYIYYGNYKAICNLGIYKERQKQEVMQLPLFDVLCKLIISYI